MAAPSGIKIVRDLDGFPLEGIIGISSYVDRLEIVANTNTAYTVPDNGNYVILSATADFYMKSGGVATVPAGSITDGSSSILNPTARSVTPGQTLGFISTTACVITIEVFT
jgi:hypothetical protein